MPNCEIDGGTAYVTIDPSGLGATLEQVPAGVGVRHVVVCGPRPGAGKSGAVEWTANRGPWYLTGTPHVTRSALRVNVAREAGKYQVHVSRVEPWFGELVEPADAAEAMRFIRGVCAEVGVRPFGTPGQTGRRMIEAQWGDRRYLAPPAGVADLLRSTSGQGRFELFPAAAAGGVELVGVDARFQYAALAQLELPTGAPVELAGEPGEYAPSWCEIEFAPAGALGVLGVAGRGGWQYPTDPSRTYYGWCSGAELQLAREVGYRVTVRRAIVWPARTRTLAAWSRLIVRERDRVERLPIRAGVKAAARAGLRAIVVQAIGSLHGRTAPAPPSVSASADMEGGAGAFVHPEWSTAIWSAARVRLARRMLEQSAPLVACALDGYYVAGEPELPIDTRAPGTWREVWRGGQWAPLRSMPELYALREAAA